MYCPNCGKATSVEQNFCRSCGLSLEKTAQSLTEQIPTVELNKHLRERQRLVERLLTILVGGGISIFVVIMIWTIIDKMIIGKGHVLGGLMIIAFILGLVLLALLMMYRDSLIDASSKRQLPQPRLPRSEPTTRLLPEPYFEPIPSVTERTTELLMAEKKGGAKEV